MKFSITTFFRHPIFQDRVLLGLFGLALILNLAVWWFWKTKIGEADKIVPLIYSSALLGLNTMLAVLLRSREPLAAQLLLGVAAIAQALFLILERYWFLIKGVA